MERVSRNAAKCEEDGETPIGNLHRTIRRPFFQQRWLAILEGLCAKALVVPVFSLETASSPRGSHPLKGISCIRVYTVYL